MSTNMTMRRTDRIIIALAVRHLPPLDGISPQALRPVRVVRRYTGGEPGYQSNTHVVAFVGHPDYEEEEEVLAYLTIQRGRVSAAWGYGAHDVNGVSYPTQQRANQVRAALDAEGLGEIHPAHPRARRALVRHGVA